MRIKVTADSLADAMDQISSDYPNAEIDLDSRRNKSGHFSANGHSFYFSVIEAPEEYDEPEEDEDTEAEEPDLELGEDEY